MTDYRYQHLIRRDCPLPPGTPVVVYCRDSGGEEQDRSVAQQVEAAREYCDQHNLLLEHVYIDEARLSSNTEKRDHLREMLSELRRRFKHVGDRYKRERIAREKPFGVIFWKSNRLGRDSIEATNIKTDLRLRGITLIDLVTSANTGNAAIDALIEAFQQWQDEQALDEISSNAKRGLAQLVSTRDTDPEFLKYNPGWISTGAYLGIMPGGVPTGFKGQRVQIGVYKRKKGRVAGDARIVQRIVPDPETWNRCYLAWEMRHGGASYDEILQATRLFKNVNGYVTFFANRIYTGDLEYGGVVYENFVPALIPHDWYEQEKTRRQEHVEKLSGRKVERQHEPARIGSEHLLSGMIYCGYIDGEEHPCAIESIPAKKGKRTRYTFAYCTVAKNSRKDRCQAKRISTRYLESLVIDTLLQHILTPENLRPIGEAIAQSLDVRSHDATARIAALQEQLREVEKAISNMMDAIEKMGYSEHLQKRYGEAVKKEEQLRRELATLQALQLDNRAISALTDDTLDQWIAFLRTTLTEDKVMARRLLQRFIDRIVIRETSGTIYYSFPLSEVLYISSIQEVDLRGSLLNTRYASGLDRDFDIPPQPNQRQKLRYTDKDRLHHQVLTLRAQGMSYREIGSALSLHWTRIQQILRS